MGERVKLGDVGDYIRGVTYKASEDLSIELTNNYVTLLRANNIQDGRLDLTEVQYVNRNKVKDVQYLKQGDILICASSGSKNLVGKAAYIQKDMDATFGAFCCVIRPSNVSSRYMAHYFQSTCYRNAIEASCTGSNINNLKAANFRELSFIDYGQHNQDIINELDAVKNQLALLRLQLAKLDQLVKSQFVEMFGDPTRQNRFEVARLGEVYQVKSSKRIYAREQTGSGIPFYRLADIGSLIDGRIPSPELYISESRYLQLKAEGYVPLADDILVTARGTLGRCYIVTGEDRFYFQDGMITWLSKTKKSPLPAWLVELFSNAQFLERLNSSCSGTTVRYLSISDLANTQIPIPPLPLQQQFSSFVAEVDKSRFVARKSAELIMNMQALDIRPNARLQ